MPTQDTLLNLITRNKLDLELCDILKMEIRNSLMNNRYEFHKFSQNF